MFDHFEIKTTTFESSKRFYIDVLLPLNIELKWADESAAGFGIIGDSKVKFMIQQFDSSTSHIAFSATDKAAVNEFYRIGIKNGFRDNGKPGIRE